MTNRKDNALDPIQLNDVIQTSSHQLARIMHKAKRLQMIQNLLPDVLPDHLQHQVTVMNLSATHLILQVNNGAFASALRMYHDQLLKYLNAEPLALRIAGIKIKVRPS